MLAGQAVRALPRMTPTLAASMAVKASRTVHVDASSLRGKHLNSLLSLTGDEMKTLLDLSAALKVSLRGNAGVAARTSWQPLRGRSLAMIFQKRSTRTRVSTEVGFTMLGGHPLFLGAAKVAGLRLCYTRS